MKLTPRQWATYRLIKENSEQGIRTTQGDIIANYPIEEHKDGYAENANPKAHDKCSAIWTDITALNKSPEIEKIIIIDNFTYRISNKEETAKYVRKQYEKAIACLARVAIIKRKMLADGQGKLISCQGEEIDDESNARNFVDSFIGR